MELNKFKKFSLTSTVEWLHFDTFNDMNQQTNWNYVWEWQGPQRIQRCLWLAPKNRLLTNQKRVWRHISTDATCLWCNVGAETTIHAIRDCLEAYDLWK